MYIEIKLQAPYLSTGYVTNVIDIVGWRKNMNQKIIVFIVGFVFFIGGYMISGETPLWSLGALISIMGGVIMGLSVVLDKIKKLYK